MAEARGLRTVESRAFLSMVAHREETLLSEIQAVGAGYPLRGRIEIDGGSGANARSVFTSSPSMGEGGGEGENSRITPSPQPSPTRGEGEDGAEKGPGSD
jgi:hypothetical protein